MSPPLRAYSIMADKRDLNEKINRTTQVRKDIRRVLLIKSRELLTISTYMAYRNTDYRGPIRRHQKGYKFTLCES